ncbi:hypothetical protein AB0469_32150 [Streptomyces sp. NPDC093801]|uniref:hypothetical protein n=1 Tax=Streptomyces sp. NPDC093801 TaxID=3155203 RepID=UPI00344F2AA1
MDSPTTRMRTPRAAGTAGVVFSLLLGAAIVLMRIAIPSGNPAEAAIEPDVRWAVRLALEIVPFAGIFFLWFMGALRAHSGEGEDRFLATVFLGSGYVFIATLFVAAAAAGTVLQEAGSPPGFGRPFAYAVLSTYAMRMAAVFVFSTSTIARRLGVFPRPLVLLGFAAGLVLLVTGSWLPWIELVFPLWVLAVSLHILRVNLRRPH